MQLKIAVPTHLPARPAHFSLAYQWCESWWTPASLEQTCALANCHVQLLVASTGGVRTRFGCEPGKARGKLSSIAIGLRVSDGVKKKMVRVVYALYGFTLIKCIYPVKKW